MLLSFVEHCMPLTSVCTISSLLISVVNYCQSTVANDCDRHSMHLITDSLNIMYFSVAGEGVDPAVMQQVAKMVGQSCSTCSKAMRAEGIKVTAM